MVYIYALKLKCGKYYIGKTSNPNFRIESHFNSKGSEWTKIYKPEKILELVKGDDYDEDKYTKIYMDKYGIDNVRGGSYTSVKLDKETKNQLVKISNSTNNRCFNCGKDGHFIAKCPETKNIIQDNVRGGYYTSVKLDKETKNQLVKISNSTNNRYFKCKDGHFIRKCPETKNIIQDNVKCYVCGKNDHKKEECMSIYWHCNKCYKEFDTKTSCINHEKYCHYEVNCYKL
jgi:hypothetical protein